jgi:hypothetical protein
MPAPATGSSPERRGRRDRRKRTDRRVFEAGWLAQFDEPDRRSGIERRQGDRRRPEPLLPEAATSGYPNDRNGER